MRPIFIRKLSKEEKTELKKLLKSTNTRLYKRARVIWLSATQHLKATEITEIVDLHLNKVRKFIRRFNRKGIDGLYQRASSGRPPEIKPKQRKQIIKLLKTKPATLGLSISSWNLRDMAEIIQDRKIVDSISHMHLWRVIKEEGYSYKRSKRWITSPDPEYEVKKTLSRGRLGVWTRLVR
jgi:transposase